MGGDGGKNLGRDKERRMQKKHFTTSEHAGSCQSVSQ